MEKYNHKKIEKKWQKKWQDEKLYQVDLDKAKKPFYNLMMFPYPSAEGLHVGNMYAFVHSDAYGRFKRLQGYDVFEPIGLDGFGIHSENYAIKIGEHIKDVSKRTEKHFYDQLHKIGNGYNWSRTVETYNPNYYKWTQWLFLKMYEKGLAYRKKSPVNWCPSCKTVLSDEQVISGKCERCDSEVEKKQMNQWFFKITDYAEKLLKNLETLDWSEEVKTIQKNWIGKSIGAKIKFDIKSEKLGFDKIYLATGNKSKIERFKKICNKIYPNVKIEQVPEIIEVEETKDSAIENAIDKVAVYKNKYDCPIIAGDTAVFFDNEKFNPTHVKRICLGDRREGDLSQKKIAEMMVEFYKNIARKNGGEKEFYYEDGWAMLLPNGEIKKISYKREYILTTEEVRERKIYFPMRNLYYSKTTGKRPVEQSDNDHAKEFNGQAKAINYLFEDKIEIFTTRPDTLFGCTYMVVSPENSLIENYKSQITNYNEVEKYIESAKIKSEIDRTDNTKEKTGVELKGVKAINPVNNEEIPIFVADYVLSGYGTGAIMAVPAHDERDFEFAKKYNLPIRQVVKNVIPAEAGIKNVKEEKNCIIVHGSPKRNIANEYPQNKKHWILWIKTKLEGQGIRTHNILMPQPWKPNYENWKKEFEKAEINENTILIGHSAGGAFSVRWLSEKQKRIKKLILIAPSKETTKDSERLKEFCNFNINEKIKSFVKEIIIFISNDKEETIKSSKIYQKKLKAKLIELKNKGHFTLNGMGTEEFPELLDEILKPECFVGEGININSDFLNGLKTGQAKEKMIEWLEKNNCGKRAVNYKLRDWCVSRQRYWGPPIPMVYCEKCKWQTIHEKDLPVELPEMDDFLPDGSGKGPLNKIEKFVNTTCPKCGTLAKRETDVSDPFVDSCWYFLRYLSTDFKDKAIDKKRLKKWMPVNMYIGGKEHSVLHLLYSRFVNMVMNELGYSPNEEPFKKFRAHGLLIKDGAKMSKSKGNVVNPDEYIEKYGADAVRMYLMFIGDMRQGGDWNDNGMAGMHKFICRVWNIFNDKIQINSKSQIPNDEINKLLNKTIKGVGEDLENLKYNTAISKLMILMNKIKEVECNKEEFGKFLILFAPFAPFMAEELWSQIGNKESIFKQKWPDYNSELIKDETINLAIQVNGKLRGTIEVKADILEDEAKKVALKNENIKKWMENKEIVKIIFVKGRLINFIIQ